MAFTEFFCRSGGSNLNGGGLASGAEPLTTPVYSGVGDSDGTNVFTPSDGSTPASTVTVGDFASVYVTSGATVATFIGRVTQVNAGANGAITVSTTAKTGTFPSASAGAHTITCKVGGAWSGPATTVSFPFGFLAAATTNSSGDIPRINFKNDATYSITAAMTHGVAGPIRFQGYTTNANDGGKAIIDGGTTGASYVLLTYSSSYSFTCDMIFQNNGATTNATGVSITGSPHCFLRCVVNNVRGNGFSSTATVFFYECEAYACDATNDVSKSGFDSTGSTTFCRCISHDNVPAGGGNGFSYNGTSGTHMTLIDCIAESNTGAGFRFPGGAGGEISIINTDFYNNGTDGIRITAGAGNTALINVDSCNFIKNTGYGVNGAGGGTRFGRIVNCGFGNGTQANTLGTTNVISSLEVLGSVTYPANVTPWVDPANGDFRINLAQAKGAGHGSFTETATSYAGTIGYPDIGAAQHKDSQRGHTFS